LIARTLLPGPDPRDGVSRVFNHGRHVMRIGVHDAVGIAYDRDMAVPQNHVAALQWAGLRQSDPAAGIHKPSQ
jgi:hypothetical protein